MRFVRIRSFVRFRFRRAPVELGFFLGWTGGVDVAFSFPCRHHAHRDTGSGTFFKYHVLQRSYPTLPTPSHVGMGDWMLSCLMLATHQVVSSSPLLSERDLPRGARTQ